MIYKLKLDIEGLDNVKATKKVTNELKVRLDGFHEIEHIQMIREVLLPKMNHFSKHIDSLLQDNEAVKRCMREFDKSISIKASKSDLLITKGDMEQRFIHNDKWVEVLKSFD